MASQVQIPFEGVILRQQEQDARGKPMASQVQIPCEGVIFGETHG